MKRAVIVGLSVMFILFVIAGIYSSYSPWITLKKIRTAAEAQDKERLRDLIDFESVRSNLKEDLRGIMIASIARDLKDNPFAAMDLALADKMLDPMIDAFVNPSTILQATSFRRMVPGEALNKRSSSPDSKIPVSKEAPKPSGAPQALSRDDVDVTGHYDGYSRYRVTIRPASEQPENATGLILRREGLFSWKVSRIILPKFLFENRKVAK